MSKLTSQLKRLELVSPKGVLKQQQTSNCYADGLREHIRANFVTISEDLCTNFQFIHFVCISVEALQIKQKTSLNIDKKRLVIDVIKSLFPPHIVTADREKLISDFIDYEHFNGSLSLKEVGKTLLGLASSLFKKV